MPGGGRAPGGQRQGSCSPHRGYWLSQRFRQPCSAWGTTPGSLSSLLCHGAPSPASPGSGAGGCNPCRQTQSTDLRGREPVGPGEESGGQGLWELVPPTLSLTHPPPPDSLG
ncbi:unnamed protein product [Caretta caretta]